MATMQERLRQHRRQERWRFIRRMLLLGLTMYGLWSGWVYIHRTDLAIGSITIHGSSLLTVKEAIELGGSQPPFNFFNVSRSRLADALKHDIRFQNSRVDYQWPTNYEVYVEEREPALYVANSYRSYLQVDYQGIVMNVTTGIPDARAPLLAGAKSGNVFLGDKVDNPKVLSILQFLQQLSGEARDRIAEIALDNRDEVKLRLRNSFPILLGPVDKLPGKGTLFMTVFNEIKNKNIQAEYIDLTFAKPYIKLIPKKEVK